MSLNRVRLKTVFIVTGRFDEETSDDERLVSGQERERERERKSFDERSTRDRSLLTIHVTATRFKISVVVRAD